MAQARQRVPPMATLQRSSKPPWTRQPPPAPLGTSSPDGKTSPSAMKAQAGAARATAALAGAARPKSISGSLTGLAVQFNSFRHFCRMWRIEATVSLTVAEVENEADHEPDEQS